MFTQQITYSLRGSRKRLSYVGFAALFFALLITAVSTQILSINQSTNALGLTFYVSPSGSGTSTDMGAPGSVNSTITDMCATGPGAGDTIVFLDGTYDTSDASVNLDGRTIRIENKNCGTASNMIVLRSQSKHGAVINVDGLPVNGTDAAAFKPINSSYLRIEDFFIEGNQQAGQLFGPGVETQGSHHIEVVGNHIEDTVGGGVTTQQSTHIYIADNDIIRGAWQHPNCSSNISFYQHTNPMSFPDDANGYSNYIINNRVYSSDNLNFAGCFSSQPSDGNCVIIDVSNELGYYANHTLVAGNVCVDNGGRGLQSLSSSHIDFYNNTVYLNVQTTQPYTSNLMVTCDDRDSGFGSTDINFVGNVVQRNPGTDTFRSAQFNSGNDCPLDVDFQNNVFIDDDISSSTFAGGISINTTTDITDLDTCGTQNFISATVGQIGFINPIQDISTADFDIPLTSILVDRGCPLPGGFTTDIDGDPRNSRQAPDIGAHEYQNNVPSDIALSSNSIDEGVGGNSLIGTLTTTDADGVDSHSYIFATGTGDEDNADFSISSNELRIVNSPDYETQDTYSVRIQTDDGNGGIYEESFTITINDLIEPDTDPPVITLLGDATVQLQVGDSYTDAGATATDDVDGDLTNSIVSSFSASNPDTTTPGVYQITYDVADMAGNDAVQLARTITVNQVDSDGVSNDDENNAPNNGDANGDGTKDAEQSNVASRPNPQNTQSLNSYIALSVDSLPAATISALEIIPEPTDNQDSFDYPLGLFDFTITGVPTGSTQRVSFTLDQIYDTSTWEWRKYSASTNTYEAIPDSANLQYTTTTVGSTQVTVVSYDITDGGELDEDGIANGTIVDPSGPAVLGEEATLANTGSTQVQLSAAVGISIMVFVSSLAWRRSDSMHWEL